MRGVGRQAAANKVMIDDVKVEDLPLWVAVGLAARCARRVFPRFVAGFPKAPTGVLNDVLRAIQVAERFARQGHGEDNYAAEADGDQAVDVAVAVGRWAADAAIVNYSDAAAAAAYAAGAAADLTAGAAWANRGNVYANVARAIRGACHCPSSRTTILAELDELRGQVRRLALDDTSPLDAAVLGPLL